MKIKYTKCKLHKAFGVKENEIFTVDGPENNSYEYFKINKK